MSLETIFYICFFSLCFLCVAGTFIFWAYTNRGYDRPYPATKEDTILWLENHIKGLKSEKRTLEKLKGDDTQEIKNLNSLILKYEGLLNDRVK